MNAEGEKEGAAGLKDLRGGGSLLVSLAAIVVGERGTTSLRYSERSIHPIALLRAQTLVVGSSEPFHVRALRMFLVRCARFLSFARRLDSLWVQFAG